MKLPVFVINLATDTVRRAHMTEQLANAGIDAEFVPAVNGRALSATDRAPYDQQRSLRIYGVPMLDTEIGCYLSHYRLWQRIAQDRLPAALILEDDVSFATDIRPLLNSATANIDKFDLLRLSTVREKLQQRAPDYGRAVMALGADHRVLRLRTHVLGAGGYIVTAAGAARLLRYGRRIFMPVDHTMDRYWENKIAPYVIFPFPVHQSTAFESRIGARDPARRYDMPRRILWQRRATRLFDGVRKRAFNLLHP